MRSISTFLIVFLLPLISFAQATGDFQSFQNGNWNTTSTWARWDGANWINPAPNTPTNADGVIHILNTHTVTVTANVTTDQTFVDTGGTLVVNGGVTLTAAAGAGDDLTVDGTLTNNGTLTIASSFPFSAFIRVNGTLGNAGTISGANASTLSFEGGSTYDHQQDGGAIPTANWNLSSTCLVSGITGTALTGGLGQNFGDFTWNCTGQTAATIDLNGALTTVRGDLNFLSTNGNFVFLTTGTTYTLNVSGDFIISGSSTTVGFNSTVNPTVNVAGNFSSTNSTIYFTNTGTLTLDVNGNFSVSGGTINVAFNSSGNVTINAAQNFTLTSSPSISGTGSGTYQLNFDGSSAQTYTATSAFEGFTYVIKKNAIVTIDNASYFLGGGGFTMEDLSELQVGSTASNGAIQTGTTGGNIRVSGPRTFTTQPNTCTIVYNGTAAQVIGNGFPTEDGVNLTVNNSNGVSMNGDLAVGGVLNLLSGDLTLSTNTLTLNGSQAGTGSLVGGDNSSLVINGTDGFGTLNLSPGILKDFTINRTSSGVVTLGSDLTIKGIFTTTAGTLEIDGYTLTLSGPFAGGTGDLSTNGSSAIIVNNTGAISGNLNIIADDVLGELNLNRNGDTLNTTSAVVIDSLVLADGTLNNSASLVISPGGYIVRSAGSMTTAPGATIPYNVIYTGAANLTTGVELPSSTILLNALAIKGSATYTLNKAITINGNAFFLGGTFATGNNNITMNGGEWLISGGTVTCDSSTITMKGDRWTVNTGNFTPGTGKVVFSGTDTLGGTGTLDFNNFEVANTGNVLLPSGTMYIAGDYQATAGATVSPNGGTVELDGSTDQIIAAGGTNLFDVNINKTGGNVTIQSLLNLYGTLDVQTSTTVSSVSGNLTLISTSDEGGHDARIATLPGGASITGDVTVQRFMSEEGKKVWRHMSAPVTGATVADWQNFFPISGNFTGASEDVPIPGNPSLYYYDETVTGSVDNGWVAYPTTTNAAAISSGTGYAAFIREITDPINISLTGPINQGDYTFTVTYTNSGSSSDDGWNLVSNPYPSQIDWDLTTGWTKTNIGGSVAVKDNGIGSFRYWNGSTGALNGGLIAIGQGFWVQTNNSSPALVVKEAAKVGDSAPFYRIQALTNHLKLALSINDTTDYTFVHFREDATDEFDWDFDAHKLKNDIQNLYTVIDDSVKIAINSLELVRYIDKTIKVGISNVHPGDYVLKISDLNTFEGPHDFTLIDHFTNTTTPIPADSSFTYTVNVTDDPASFGNDRLEIAIVAIITGLEDEVEDLVTVFPNPSTGLFNYKIKSDDYIEEAILMDTKGSIIKMFNFGGQKQTKTGSFDLSDQRKGLYLLRIKLGSSVIVKKLAVE